MLGSGQDFLGSGQDAAARLDAYRSAYRFDAPLAALDAGLRAADAHVAAHDPLRGRIVHPAWPDAVADVALGVDPGTYFCGGLAHALAGRSGARTGFVHVPPDERVPRPALLDLIGAVVAALLAALAAERPWRRALLTGFGPFPGVADNPTAAFVGDQARIASASGGRAHAVVLRLAAEDGTMHEAMGPVLAQLDAAWAAAGEPDVVIGLGVDSRQALLRPRFTIETQSRGMHERVAGQAIGPRAAARPLDDLALAALRTGAFGAVG